MSDYQWVERPDLARPHSDGKTWVTREMVSYRTALDRFIPHLQAMGEGLEDAEVHFWGDTEVTDDDGVFVVGLRDTSAEDAEAERQRAARIEAQERGLLAELLEKYQPEVES